MGIIREKRRIVELLQAEAIEAVLLSLRGIPGPKLINPLFAGLCSNSEVVKWHAVTAMGAVVAEIAEENPEAARIIMRRLMWSLNDESAGIGWGAPEAMAEIMAGSTLMAAEYSHILVSYMREDGNYLEHPVLQRGLLWGICRLAQTKPELLHKYEGPRYLLPYLASSDAACRGLAAKALGILGAHEAHAAIAELLDDPHPLRLYWERTFAATTVGRLAAMAIKDMDL